MSTYQHIWRVYDDDDDGHDDNDNIIINLVKNSGSWNVPAFCLDSLSEGRASLLEKFRHKDKMGMKTKKL